MKADSQVVIALATGALAYGAYQVALPTVADTMSLPKNNAHIQTSERTAAWVSGVLVAGIALVTKSAITFVVGGSVVVAASWMHRHADQISPTQKAAVAAGPQPATGVQGIVGDQVSASQSSATTPVYGVAV